MIPVPFKTQNTVFKAEGCGDLPARRNADRTIITCWQLSEEDLEEVRRTGKVWLTIWGGQPPVMINAQEPALI